ncbi:hypothetical protein ARSEF1564_008418 [Beauveria bassiana]
MDVNKETSTSNYKKRKQTHQHFIEPEKRTANFSASTFAKRPTRATRRKSFVGKEVPVGHWRNPPASELGKKHIVVAYIDASDYLRTRIGAIVKDGGKMPKNFSRASRAGRVTFDQICFYAHLVGLDRLQVKEYVRQRVGALESTEQDRIVAEQRAVDQAIVEGRRLLQISNPLGYPSKLPQVAKGEDLAITLDNGAPGSTAQPSFVCTLHESYPPTGSTLSYWHGEKTLTERHAGGVYIAALSRHELDEYHRTRLYQGTCGEATGETPGMRGLDAAAAATKTRTSAHAFSKGTQAMPANCSSFREPALRSYDDKYSVQKASGYSNAILAATTCSTKNCPRTTYPIHAQAVSAHDSSSHARSSPSPSNEWMETALNNTAHATADGESNYAEAVHTTDAATIGVNALNIYQHRRYEPPNLPQPGPWRNVSPIAYTPPIRLSPNEMEREATNYATHQSNSSCRQSLDLVGLPRSYESAALQATLRRRSDSKDTKISDGVEYEQTLWASQWEARIAGYSQDYYRD